MNCLLNRVVVLSGICFCSGNVHADFPGLDQWAEIYRANQVAQELQKLNRTIDQFPLQKPSSQKTDIIIHNHGPTDHATLYVVQNSTGQPTVAVERAVPLKKIESNVANGAQRDEVVPNNCTNGKPPFEGPRISWLQRIKNFVWSNQPRVEIPQQDDSLWGYLKSHKKEIIVKGALVGYVYVNYRLFSLSSYLQSTERWHFWRSDKTLSQLLALPPKDVARDLVYEIKRRYVSYSGDNAEPFIQFMKAIEDEIEAYNSYLSLANILTKIDMLERHCVFCCGRLLPRQLSPITNFVVDIVASKISIKSAFPYLDEQLVASSQESLSRLTFLRSCFAQWLAEVKVLRLGLFENGALL